MLRRSQARHYARIRVAGIGSGGISAVNHMIRGGIRGVSFVTIDLASSGRRRTLAPTHLELSQAALSGKEREQVRQALVGADLVFIVAGLGGQTGTAVAPEVANLVRSLGALAVGIVTHPFSFEGLQRAAAAAAGTARLEEMAHTVIVIRNDRLLENNCDLPFHETYRLAHDVWFDSIQAINELVNRAGLVNVDFADVRAIVEVGGAAVIGSGLGTGPQRAYLAAQQAISSPLLDSSIDGARGVLFNVTGGNDLCLSEVHSIAAYIQSRIHPEANIIFGATVDASLEDELQLILIATGGGRMPTTPRLSDFLAVAGAMPAM